MSRSRRPGAIAELIQAGYVCHIGLSEAGVGSMRRPAATYPIADLQIECSLFSRGIEREIRPLAASSASGSRHTAYSP